MQNIQEGPVKGFKTHCIVILSLCVLEVFIYLWSLPARIVVKGKPNTFEITDEVPYCSIDQDWEFEIYGSSGFCMWTRQKRMTKVKKWMIFIISVNIICKNEWQKWNPSICALINRKLSVITERFLSALLPLQEWIGCTYKLRIIWLVLSVFTFS